MSGSVIGYYVNPDDALCPDHAPAGFAEGDYSRWGGFPGWESPAPILESSEGDSPTHCAECEALIPHALTADGYDYLAERAVMLLTGGGGRAEIQAQWWAAYGDGLSAGQLRRIAAEAGIAHTGDVTAAEIGGLIARMLAR